MNSSLHDIQADIQRLATQQKATEMLAQQKQHEMNSQKYPAHLQQLHQQHYPVQHVQHQQPYYNNMQPYMSVGHVPQGMQFSQVMFY